MSLTYPYVKVTVTDGVTDVLASHHNLQEDQLVELTKVAYRHDNQCVVAVRPGELTPGAPVDVLTSRALDTMKTIRATVGASGLITLTTTNGVGPVGTGIPTNYQRFTVPTLAAMGALTGSGVKTMVRLVLYENNEQIGWEDVWVVAP
jgi:hypothetical protein